MEARRGPHSPPRAAPKLASLPPGAAPLCRAGTLFNVLVVFYMLFTGLSTALCACTGKCIGAGRAQCVPALIRIALGLSTLAAAAAAAALYLGRLPLVRQLG